MRVSTRAGMAPEKSMTPSDAHVSVRRRSVAARQAVS